MPDYIDMAQEREEQDREIALKYGRRPELPQIGSCFNCSEPIARGNFCSPDCREDYEKRKRFNHGKE